MFDTFFSQAAIDSVVADSNAIVTVFANQRNDFVAQLAAADPRFAAVPEDYIKLMFTNLFIYSAKPYGQGPNGQPLEVLLAQPTLDCSTLCDAATWLFEKLTPTSGASVSQMGWGASRVGGHAELMIGLDGYPSMLIDPTAMLFAFTGGMNELVSGVPIPRSDQMMMGWRNDTANDALFRTKLANVLEDGQLRGGQVSYWSDDSARVSLVGGSGNLPTPLREWIGNGNSNDKQILYYDPINQVSVDATTKKHAGSSAGDWIVGTTSNDIIFGGGARDIADAMNSHRAKSATAAFFSAAQIAGVRADSSTIQALYTAEEARFKTMLGSTLSALSDLHVKLAFASTLVHDMVTTNTTKVTDFAAQLAATSMNVESQSVFAWQMFRALTPTIDHITLPTAPDVVMLVWNGDPVGHHSQLMISNTTGQSLVVDTAAGHIAYVDSYNAMVGGDRVTSGQQVSTYWRGDQNAFVEQAWTSFEDGLYRLQNMLTWYEQPADYQRFDTTVARWLTPQGDPYRIAGPISDALGDYTTIDRIDGAAGVDLMIGDGATVSGGTQLDAGATLPPQWRVGDFNGDGRADLFRGLNKYEAGAQVYLSDGDGFLAAKTWSGQGSGYQQWLLGDFNGDGRTDIGRMMTKGAQLEVHLSDPLNYFRKTTIWTGNGAGGNPFVAGDFNGDGKDDLLRWNATAAITQVMLSDGTKFLGAITWTTQVADKTTGSWTVGDYNGDGKDDLLRLTKTTTAKNVEVLLSTGTTFSVATNWGTIGLNDTITVADLNGDGMDDLVHSVAGVSGYSYVHYSNSSSFGGGTTFAPVDRTGNAIYAGDFDGDTYDDLVVTPTATAQNTINMHYGTPGTGANDVDLFIMRKGEIQSDLIYSFQGDAAGGRDRIQFEGYGDGTGYSVTASGAIVTITATTGTAYTESFTVVGTAQGLSNADWYFIT